MTAVMLASAARANDFNIVGVDDSEVASRALARWSTAIGMKPEKVFEDGEFVLRERKVWSLSVKPMGNSSLPDRIVLRTIFKGKKENLSSPSALRLINKLNSSYNACSFCFDDDGDFVMEFNLCFDDVLSPSLYRMFLRNADFFVDATLQKHKAELDLFTL
jgi:hypothetical protein